MAYLSASPVQDNEAGKHPRNFLSELSEYSELSQQKAKVQEKLVGTLTAYTICTQMLFHLQHVKHLNERRHIPTGLDLFWMRIGLHKLGTHPPEWTLQVNILNAVLRKPDH